MHYIYIIQNKKHNYIDVGNTNNIEKRLEEYNNCKVQATKRYVPFKLVYYEAYLNRKDATKREYKLKHHGSAIGHLKKRLKNSLA